MTQIPWFPTSDANQGSYEGIFIVVGTDAAFQRAPI